MTDHAPSLYAATAGVSLAFPALAEKVQTHVCIIGGGFTGLSAALHLAERGVEVVLLEAERVGWGASGRNGGQLHSGQRRDQDWLRARFGRETAHGLWDMAEEAKSLVHKLIAQHGIDCDWRSGLIEAVHKPRLLAGECAYVETLRRDYGYDKVDWLDREALTAAIGTSAYYGGRRDRGAGHLDPLKLSQGLARAAETAGARIFEGTRAIGVAGSAGTGFDVEARRDGSAPLPNPPPRGARESHPCVHADIVILAGNGYLEGIDADTEARVLPIANYILATEPIGAGAAGGLIPGGEAVSDSRFVVYYWRPAPDGRLVFGGGETYSRQQPRDVAAFVRRHLLKIYPGLAGTRVDFAWGGILAITRHRLPYVRRVRPGVYAAAGYSGQGVALAPYAGKVLADAVAGDVGLLDRFAALPCPRFPGGRWLRGPALIAGMSWYALRDRL